jgi:small GTP-binding protein
MVLRMTDREGAFKLCIFGDGGVGKTTLVNRYLTKVFDEDIKMTVGADFYVKDLEIDGKKVVIRIWDFGGEQRFKVLLPSFAKGADGGIFMYDITRYTSVKNVDDWLSIFEKNVREQQIEIPIIMVGGKLDLHEKRSVETEDATQLAEKFNLQGHFECSSKTGDKVEDIFESITRKMMSFTGML